ncbi:MAG: hypothetical protein ACPICC_04625 [Candidatus Puniceispirillaceae bacterium]
MALFSLINVEIEIVLTTLNWAWPYDCNTTKQQGIVARMIVQRSKR